MTSPIPQGPLDIPQQPVPNNPIARRVSYQVDPFASTEVDAGGAQVTEGSGQTYTAQLGFKTKPYQYDPFDQTTGSRRGLTPYTQRTAPVIQQEIQEQQRLEEEAAAPPPVDEPTRLEGYQETGELTPENVPDVYSLTEEELPAYGIDINAPNVGEAPPEIVSGWNDADGDGYDDDGHAMGTHGAVNVQTAAGEQSIQDALNYADPLQADTLGGAIRGGIDRGLDYVDQYAQPGTRTLDSGTEVTTSPGGAVSLALPPGFGALAAIGGGINAANLNRVHGRIEEDPEYGTYYERGSIPGVDTDIAVHEGFIPGTRVVSGATHMIPGLRDQGDETPVYAPEVEAYAEAAQAAEAARQREAEIQRQLEQDAALRAQALAAERAAEQARIEAQRQEQERIEREAADRARAEAERRENQRRANEELERQRQRDRDNERAQIQQGRAVTDSSGRAVRDSSGRIVTDRPSQRNDDGGGGGDDGCFAKGTAFKMADGTLKAIEDIKPGDIMLEGGRVHSIVIGDGTTQDWYEVGDSYVTGSHAVYETKKRLVPVWKSKWANALLFSGYDTFYCVNNANHIMVAGDGIRFSDYDMVDNSTEKLLEVCDAVSK